jgi:hypothetical protein
MKPATAADRAYQRRVSLCVDVSENAYSAIRQLARETGCKLDDVLTEALSALLTRTGKGSIGEIDMRGTMIAEVETSRIDRAEEVWDRTGDSVTMRLAIDLPPELYLRLKTAGTQRRVHVADMVRALLEVHFPEVGAGRAA